MQSVCLVVEQSYPQVDEEFSLPIAEACQRMLRGIGIVVAERGDPCDATLTVALTGQALGAAYSGGRHCYTGAEVSGQVTIDASGYVPLVVPVSGKSPPSKVTASCPSSPNRAPFFNAWSVAVIEGLAGVWGAPILIQALGDEVWQVRRDAARELGKLGSEVVIDLIQALQDDRWQRREGAARALAEIGPEAREAVPALIGALEDEDRVVREKVAWALETIGPGAEDAVPALIQALGEEDGNLAYNAYGALKAITRQDFGFDAARWQQWWEEQK